MDESNVPKTTEVCGSFSDDLFSLCHREESEKPSTTDELEDPCSRFSMSKDKIHQFDGQSAKDVTELWMAANKTLYPTLTNGIFPLLGQSKEEVNTLLDVSEKQGERDPATVVEKIVVSEHTINEIKKQIERLHSYEQSYYTPPPVFVKKKKRRTKYDKLKISHDRLEKRVAVLEELCKCLTEKKG